MSNLFLPLESDAFFSYDIKLDGGAYRITIRWNQADQAWYMDIVGNSNTVVKKGIKLVGGTNLLEPFAVLELGALYVVDLEGEDLDPDFEGLGDRYQLVYVEKE